MHLHESEHYYCSSNKDLTKLDNKMATPDYKIPSTPQQTAGNGKESSTSTPTPSPVTRKTATIFGLGRGITTADSNITGSHLPTSEQGLRCLMHHRQEKDMIMLYYINHVINWQDANILCEECNHRSHLI